MFHERVRFTLNDILSREGMPLIVCHGGVFRAFRAISSMNHEAVDNCALYSFNPAMMNNIQGWQVNLIR
jgi:broad specificity phosphatase PhoE